MRIIIVFFAGTALIFLLYLVLKTQDVNDIAERKSIIGKGYNLFFVDYDNEIRKIDSVSSDTSFIFSKGKVFRIEGINLVQ